MGVAIDVVKVTLCVCESRCGANCDISLEGRSQDCP